MKHVLITLLLISSYSMAGGSYEPPVSSSESTSTSISAASSKANSGSVSTATVGDVVVDNQFNPVVATSVAGDTLTVEGSTWNAGDVTVEGPTLTTGSNYQRLEYKQARPFVQFQPPVGQHTIGETSVSVGGCGGNVGVVSELGRSESAAGGTVGCVWIPGQGEALKKAQRMQDYKLHVMKVQLLHAEEKHQAEMVQTCETLHENYEYRGVVTETPEGYYELDFDSPEFYNLSRTSLALWQRCKQAGHYDFHGPKQHNQNLNPRQFSPTEQSGNPRQVSPHEVAQ